MVHDLPPAKNESSPLLNRRRLLTILGLGAAATLVGDTAQFNHAPRRITAYLPTWLPTESYEHMRANISPQGTAIDRVHLAFGHFNSADATAGVPVMAPEAHEFISEMAPDTDLSLSLGGGAASEHSWRAAWANRSQYGKSVNDSRLALEDSFQRPVHVDIDCEKNVESHMLTELTQAVRDSLSDQRDISMAVPASHQLERFNTSPTMLGGVVDTFRVMTYDQYGPWSESAGPVATGEWVLSAMDTWVRKVGDATKLEVGYPTYGYKYSGANQAGDNFSPTEHPSVLYADLPEGTIRDDPELMTSEATLDESWVGCLSPRMIGAIAMRLQSHHPSLGGSFFWSMEGVTAAHLDAVRVIPKES